MHEPPDTRPLLLTEHSGVPSAPEAAPVTDRLPDIRTIFAGVPDRAFDTSHQVIEALFDSVPNEHAVRKHPAVAAFCAYLANFEDTPGVSAEPTANHAIVPDLLTEIARVVANLVVKADAAAQALESAGFSVYSRHVPS